MYPNHTVKTERYDFKALPTNHSELKKSGIYNLQPGIGPRIMNDNNKTIFQKFSKLYSTNADLRRSTMSSQKKSLGGYFHEYEYIEDPGKTHYPEIKDEFYIKRRYELL